VNQHFAIHPLAPFGGWKHSGLGCENGPRGLAEYAAMQVVHAAPAAPIAPPG
jgi:acyl-CoA reductase-like NAD-dependent aldehyde dehydrogenase